MTTQDVLGSHDCARILERLAELRSLDALMRQPGTLAAPRQDQDDDATEGTSSHGTP